MSTTSTQTQKPKLPPPPQPMTKARITEAMKAIGYESVTFVGKNILVEIPGSERDRDGNRAVRPMSVHDILLSPGTILVDGNWPAIKTAGGLRLKFREFQLAGEDLILRDVEDIQE